MSAFVSLLHLISLLLSPLFWLLLLLLLLLSPLLLLSHQDPVLDDHLVVGLIVAAVYAGLLRAVRGADGGQGGV